MIGVFLILLDQTPTDSGVVPLIANRVANAAVMWTAVAVAVVSGRRQVPRPAGGSTAPALAEPPRGGMRLDPRGAGIAAAGGVLDAAANLLILIGLRLGDLSTVSVLTALYPAGTILLAAVVLRERVAPVQWLGLALAIAAAALLALS
jgi:drug/metabolite transporter (DMT)-like permease